MTTRKNIGRFALVVALAGAALGETGCATPGPLHIYTATSVPPATLRDLGSGATTEDIASLVVASEALTGFAYDPFTDHFILRLTPGNLIRIIDRPARAVKQEFIVAELAATGEGGDLAVRPGDGHIFLAHPTESALLELTRTGKLVGTIRLAGFETPPLGIAYDPQTKRFLTLRVRNHATWLFTHESDGRLVGEAPLSEPASPGSLGFDPAKRELYAPLASERGVGVFDEDGRLRRTIAMPATCVDVGPRSFLRMF